MKTLQEQFTKTFVPEKSEEDKIKAIDSNIKSLVKMLREEIHKKCALLTVSDIPEALVTLEQLEQEIREIC